MAKNPPANAGDPNKRPGFDPWVRKMPWRRAQQPTPIFFLENPMDRGLYSPKGHRESDMTEAT